MGRGGSMIRFSALRPEGSNPALAARSLNLEQVAASSSPTMLCIAIASAPPRRESTLLTLACTRKKGDIKDQLYCTIERLEINS